MKSIVTDSDDDDDVDKVQCDTGIANPNQTNSGPKATTMSQNDATLYIGVKKRKKTKEDERNAPTEKYILDSIFEHKANNNRRNRYAKYGDTLYRARWYDCRRDDDTWEPAKHIRRSQVLTYCCRRKLQILDDLRRQTMVNQLTSSTGVHS